MSELEYFSESLAVRLDDCIETPDAFIQVTAAGELLRRACALADRSQSTLERYDTWLSAYTGPVVEDLPHRISSALSAIEDYVSLASVERQRQSEQGEDALEALDAALCGAAAMVRMQRLAPTELERLARDAQERVCGAASLCAPLWSWAHERATTVGDDPEYGGTFGFWHELASLSEAYLQVATAVRYADAIDRAAAAFEARMASADAREAEPSRWKGLLWDALGRLGELLTVPMPAPAAVAAYDDGRSLPEIRELWQVGGGMLTLLAEGPRLVVRVAPGRRLEALTVTVDGEALTIDVVDQQARQFTIPSGGQQMVLAPTIDGTRFDIPAIALRRDS